MTTAPQINTLHLYMNGLCNNRERATLPERSKGAGLRSAVFVRVGSNPTGSKNIFYLHP
jgi:hypothetical protein